MQALGETFGSTAAMHSKIRYAVSKDPLRASPPPENYVAAERKKEVKEDLVAAERNLRYRRRVEGKTLS